MKGSVNEWGRSMSIVCVLCRPARLGWSYCLLGMFVFVLLSSQAEAVSPAVIAQGRILFEKDWSPQNPQTGSDGLGPLFNARSCVACHHQGGVGGSGDARFNAKTVAIDRFKFSGKLGQTKLLTNEFAQLFAGFHPGFANGGVIMTSFPLAHLGGSPSYAQQRRLILEQLPAKFSEHGGSTDAAEVRSVNASPIVAQQQSASVSGDFTIKARIYQRNTTSLFGAGLIDRIDSRQIAALQRAQLRNREVSGRPAGKFGWRGNASSLLDFCDKACANELGLQTRRAAQASDPTNPTYRHNASDISDQMIKTMTAFVASLPAPTRELPTDPDEQESVRRGEVVFASIGCAVCHVPNVGLAKGIYSDLLLHDMGIELRDPNGADVVDRSRIQAPSPGNGLTRRIIRGEIQPGKVSLSGKTSTNSQGASSQSESSQSQPSASSKAATASPMRTRPKSRISFNRTPGNGSLKETPRAASGYYGFTGRLTMAGMVRLPSNEFIHRPLPRYQEWRTPPLWGVRDTAPYMHDGRAGTLLEAIAMHDGEAAPTRDRFLNLSIIDRRVLIAFLNTMVAPSSFAK